MNSVFNSINEVSLRLLIILYNSNSPLSLDRLVALDFLAVYGKEFGISKYNLHGDNSYKFSELFSRRNVIDASIKYLVTNDMIEVSISNGFEYCITDKGAAYISDFDSQYSHVYAKNIMSAINEFRELDDISILKMIQSKSTMPTLRREN